ncbi:hypothetical protein EPN15_01390 [Patescibacteria group bacterium]|nr:MAG: hypothetical protein EPN15_01390 [Patescibacteria group bacterium]
MKPETSTQDTGSCPQCGSPSFAGHMADCPASKQTNERLNFEEAQEEAERVRRKAASNKVLSEERYPPSISIRNEDMLDMYQRADAEERAWDEIKEQRSRKEDELLQSKKSPFSGKNYEAAHRDVENDDMRWKRLDEKLRKYK